MNNKYEIGQLVKFKYMNCVFEGIVIKCIDSVHEKSYDYTIRIFDKTHEIPSQVDMIVSEHILDNYLKTDPDHVKIESIVQQNMDSIPDRKFNDGDEVIFIYEDQNIHGKIISGEFDPNDQLYMYTVEHTKNDPSTKRITAVTEYRYISETLISQNLEDEINTKYKIGEIVFVDLKDKYRCKIMNIQFDEDNQIVYDIDIINSEDMKIGDLDDIPESLINVNDDPEEQGME